MHLWSKIVVTARRVFSAEGVDLSEFETGFAGVPSTPRGECVAMAAVPARAREMVESKPLVQPMVAAA